jgi:hypothetical protein
MNGLRKVLRKGELAKVTAKFDKLKELGELGGEGRKEAKRLQDSWQNRGGDNAAGLWNPKGKRQASCKGAVGMRTNLKGV